MERLKRRGCLGLVAALFFTLLYMPIKVYAFSSSRECKECHEEIYSDWETTSHAKAWNNRFFVRSTNNRQKEKCLPCHSPKPLLETGVNASPAFRDHNRDEGVDCLACHKLSDSQAGGRKGLSGGCNPVMNEDVKSGRICFVCHKKEAKEWLGSSFSKKGTTCLTCHMEKISGEVVKGRRIRYAEHRWAGGKNPLYLETVTKDISISQVGSILTVRFKPRGVGHNFPTGTSGNPSFHILIRVSTDDGKEVKTFRKSFERTHDENIHDTTIAPGKEVVFSFNLPINKGMLGVICFYKNYSSLKDRDAIVVKNVLYSFDQK